MNILSVFPNWAVPSCIKKWGGDIVSRERKMQTLEKKETINFSRKALLRKQNGKL